MHKIFRYQKYSETPKGSTTKFFGTVRQKNFDGKSWYPPPLLSLTFFDTRDFLKHRKVPRRNFSALWDKKFCRRKLDTPPPLIHKLFGYRKFSETQHRTVPLRNFSALWDKKIFDGKSWYYPPLLIQLFSVPESNATVKDSPTEISGTVRQKIFEKSWYSPPPLSRNFFATGNFWSTEEKVSSTKCFGSVRQKIFDGKSWHNPLKHKLFRYPKLMTQ